MVLTSGFFFLKLKDYVERYPIFPYMFTSWFLIKHKVNITFYLLVKTADFPLYTLLVDFYIRDAGNIFSL